MIDISTPVLPRLYSGGRNLLPSERGHKGLKTGQNTPRYAAKAALCALLIFVAAFVTSRAVNASFDSGWYTDNCPRGTEAITGGVLQTRESTPGGDANNFGFCTAQRGSFPWGSSVGTALPTGLANVTVTANFLGRTPVNGSFIGSRYHLYVGFYYDLDVPQLLGGVSHQWMDTQVRIENVDGVDSFVSTTGIYDPGDSFGWDLVVAQLNPGQSYTFSTNVESQFESAVSAYGIPVTIGHSLMGIEIGTEGYQIQELDVDWSNINFDSSPAPLSVSYTVMPSSPNVGDLITFAASASGGTSPYNFLWDFGDNSSGNASTVQHVYSSGGSRTVTLTVTDSTRASTTVRNTIVITVPILFADLRFSPVYPTVGSAVNFSATGTGGTPPYSYSWKFGDTAASSGPTVSHSYSSMGSYTVVLNLTDSGGQRATASQIVNVYSPSSPDFTLSVSPSSLAIVAGHSGMATLTVGSVYGLNATVSLVAHVDPSLNISISPNKLNLVPSSSQNATVSISVLSGTSTGSYLATINGTSTSLPRSISLTIRVTSPRINHPPTIVVPSFESATPGSSLKFAVSATDLDQDEIVTLSVQHLPSGASFNSSTGVFSWTPLPSQAGDYTVSFTATDNGTPPMTNARSVSITVTALPPQGACLSCQVSNFVWANVWWVVGGTLAGLIVILSAYRVRPRSPGIPSFRNNF